MMYRIYRQIQIALSIAIILVLGYAYWEWQSTHDKEFNIAMQAYEECVVREYNMTPIEWYEQQGKYPECGTRPQKK